MLGELGVGSIGNLTDYTTVVSGAYKLTVPDVQMNDQFDARPSARHFRRANVTFMDGHVKSLRLEQFYTNQSPPDKWFCPDPSNAAACVGS
jgi:prepilin-type processing-associated H-X9-DG protein